MTPHYDESVSALVSLKAFPAVDGETTVLEQAYSCKTANFTASPESLFCELIEIRAVYVLSGRPTRLRAVLNKSPSPFETNAAPPCLI